MNKKLMRKLYDTIVMTRGSNVCMCVHVSVIRTEKKAK